MERSYNWATILYEESKNENFLQILSNSHIPCAVSPLHNQDVNANGELKKPHYHIIFHYNTLKSQKQFKEDIKQIGGVGGENIRDLRAYTRYLVHLDSPDKTQYSISDIVVFNGFEIEKFFKSDKINVDEGYTELVKIILTYGFSDFSELTIYLLNNEPSLLYACRRSAYAINALLRSNAFRLQKEIKNKTNKQIAAVVDAMKDGFVVIPEISDFEQLELKTE